MELTHNLLQLFWPVEIQKELSCSSLFHLQMKAFCSSVKTGLQLRAECSTHSAPPEPLLSSLSVSTRLGETPNRPWKRAKGRHSAHMNATTPQLPLVTMCCVPSFLPQRDHWSCSALCRQLETTARWQHTVELQWFPLIGSTYCCVTPLQLTSTLNYLLPPPSLWKDRCTNHKAEHNLFIMCSFFNPQGAHTGWAWLLVHCGHLLTHYHIIRIYTADYSR